MTQDALPERLYRFAALSFAQVVAHGGVGTIRTCRVEQQGVLGSANWIDMTIVPPGSSIGFHTHELDNEETYVVIDGVGEMTIGAASHRVGAGDVIVNPAGGSHGLRNVGTRDLRIVVLDIEVPGSAWGRGGA